MMRGAPCALTLLALAALVLSPSAAALGHSHKWQGVAAAVREELGSFFSGQIPANAQPTYVQPLFPS